MRHAATLCGFGVTQRQELVEDVGRSDPFGALISGRCLGMIGDVLVFAQGGRRFLLSVGALVAQQVQLGTKEQPNRVVGQQTLAF